MAPRLNMIKRFNRAGRSFDIQRGKKQLIANRLAPCLLTPHWTFKVDDIVKSHSNDWIPACAGMTAVLTNRY
jgi:hypothetical protein